MDGEAVTMELMRIMRSLRLRRALLSLARNETAAELSLSATQLRTEMILVREARRRELMQSDPQSWPLQEFPTRDSLSR